MFDSPEGESLKIALSFSAYVSLADDAEDSTTIFSVPSTLRMIILLFISSRLLQAVLERR